MCEYGPHQVMLFSTLRVAGQSVDLDEQQKQKVRDGVPAALQAYESLRTGRDFLELLCADPEIGAAADRG